jgi:hypothetical protein
MNKQLETSLYDYDELKREIAEAVRATLRELAAENGMSYEDFCDEFFGRTKRRRVNKRKGRTGRKSGVRITKRSSRRGSASK